MPFQKHLTLCLLLIATWTGQLQGQSSSYRIIVYQSDGTSSSHSIGSSNNSFLSVVLNAETISFGSTSYNRADVLEWRIASTSATPGAADYHEEERSTALSDGRDTLWIRPDDRFSENNPIDITEADELRFFRSKLCLYKNGAQLSSHDYSTLLGSSISTVAFVPRWPGRILWHPSDSNLSINGDYTSSANRWNFAHSRESEHFVVFWDKQYGSDPATFSGTISDSDGSWSGNVDIDDMLSKAEQFFDTNVNVLQMAKLGDSFLDKYKMSVYLLWMSGWQATGSGYDNTIGALWVSPNTCQPVGSVIAHEIGHSFQYQTYADYLLAGNNDDSSRGWRYGLGSGTANAFWEQSAQWQSFQDYPEQALTDYDVDVWMKNHHRHFHHEWQRYASYWFPYYVSDTQGPSAIGRLWRESQSPEDAVEAYSRLFCGNDYAQVKRNLFAYAQRTATFDFNALRRFTSSAANRYSAYTTLFHPVADGYYQVSYRDCPAPTGFNVVPLVVPEGGTVVTVDLQGLANGSALASDDTGSYIDGDNAEQTGTATRYNATSVSQGWAFGFVALKSNGSRVYGEYNETTSSGSASFTVPEGTSKLFLVVQGAPGSYRSHTWDDDCTNDDQLPYKIKVDGTSLLGYYTVDPSGPRSSITIPLSVSGDGTSEAYELGSITLTTSGLMDQIGKAFQLTPSDFKSICNPTGSAPAAGHISLALLQPDGSYSYNHTETNGFWMADDGTPASWGDATFYVGYANDTYTLYFGHMPAAGAASYEASPTFVYNYMGTLYYATIRLELTFTDGPTTTLKGDVNADGEVNVADVTALVNIILSGDSGSNDADAADVNADGEVNVSDVTALVAIILNSD